MLISFVTNSVHTVLLKLMGYKPMGCALALNPCIDDFFFFKLILELTLLGLEELLVVLGWKNSHSLSEHLNANEICPFSLVPSFLTFCSEFCRSDLWMLSAALWSSGSGSAAIGGQWVPQACSRSAVPPLLASAWAFQLISGLDPLFLCLSASTLVALFTENNSKPLQ